jgi:hypothetical protein
MTDHYENPENHPDPLCGIYWDGHDTYGRGESVNANPHPRHSEEYKEWKEGWDDAWCDDCNESE